MGLLDNIEKTIAKHPVTEMGYETKVHYLNAIAYFIAIDDDISDEEKKEFDKLIELLDCSEIREDLYGFLYHPEMDEFETIFFFLEEKNIFVTYLLEIFYMVKDAKVNNLEGRFVHLLMEILEYKPDEIQSIKAFNASILNRDSKAMTSCFKAILDNKKLVTKVNEFISFYRLNNSMKGELRDEVKIKNTKDEIALLSISMETLANDEKANFHWFHPVGFQLNNEQAEKNKYQKKIDKLQIEQDKLKQELEILENGTQDAD